MEVSLLFSEFSKIFYKSIKWLRLDISRVSSIKPFVWQAYNLSKGAIP